MFAPLVHYSKLLFLPRNSSHYGKRKFVPVCISESVYQQGGQKKENTVVPSEHRGYSRHCCNAHEVIPCTRQIGLEWSWRPHELKEEEDEQHSSHTDAHGAHLIHIHTLQQGPLDLSEGHQTGHNSLPPARGPQRRTCSIMCLTQNTLLSRT